MSLTPAATGDAIVELALKHLGERYVLGQRVPLANSNWKGPWDCAEFASWCTYHATGILFGTRPHNDPMRADAYTGYWREQGAAAGTLITWQEAVGIPGAMLLRSYPDQKIGHIAISDGRGGTVEARGEKYGVDTAEAGGRHWNYGVLVPGVRYFASATPVVVAPPPSDLLRLSNPMLRGDVVHALQQCMTKLGYHPGALDGIYGPQTASAVAAFQNAAGLVPDGEVGPVTAAELKAKGCEAL